MNFDIGTIITLLTLVGSISGNIFQFLRDRKKANNDLLTQLIEKSMQLNKQELDSVRGVNQYLEDKVKEQDLKIEKQEKELQEKIIELLAVRKELTLLKQEFEEYKRTHNNINKGL